MPGVVETTTYKVETLYVTRDEASRGIENIERAAHGAHGSTMLLKHALEALGVGIGIEKAKHAFIDFNREVQDAKISLSTMLQGNFNVGWDTAVDGANRLYTEFQRFSQLTPVTTQEMLEFGRGVTVATAQAGGSMKDIIAITEQGVVAAKALGMESNYASLELTEMLMGNVSRRMRFAQQILGFAKMDEKEFRALSGQQRLGVVEKVLMSPAMKNATNAFSTSFSGVLSTFEDKLQILFGKIGLPLFQALTKEIAGWNQWLDRNQEKVDRFASTVAHGLVEAFHDVKVAFEFIADHADTLITIGKVWAAIKIGNMLGSGIGGMLGRVGGLGGLGESVGGVGGIIKNAGPIGAAGLGGYQLGRALGLDKVGEHIGSSLYDMIHGAGNVGERFEELERASASLDRAFQHASSQFKDSGFVSSNQAVQGQLQTQIRVLDAVFKRLGTTTGVNGPEFDVNRALSNAAAMRTAADFDVIKDELNKIGITTQEMAEGGGLMKVLTALRTEQRTVQGRAELSGLTGALAMAIAPLIGLSQDQLRAQQTANQLFGLLNRTLAGGGHLFDPATFKAIIDILKEGAKDPFKGQARVNQNITNHIQVEVSAKDPDRWMAELDAKVQRKLRAPSQAKGAIVTRGGM